jgi:hypothetical protein
MMVASSLQARATSSSAQAAGPSEKIPNQFEVRWNRCAGRLEASPIRIESSGPAVAGAFFVSIQLNLNSEVDGERTRLGCCFPRPRGKRWTHRNFQNFFVRRTRKRLDARHVQQHPWRVCSPLRSSGLRPGNEAQISSEHRFIWRLLTSSPA